jgi:hypothetical protein
MDGCDRGFTHSQGDRLEMNSDNKEDVMLKVSSEKIFINISL